MKSIQKAFLISLVPLLTPMSVMAQTGIQSDRDEPSRGTNTAQDRKGDADTWRASKVIGLDVKNAASDSMGKVEDVVLDLNSGEIVAVIISSGGFLGIGEAHSAVPHTILRYDEQAEGFKTKLTKEQLSRAPQFKANEWPDYSDASSSEALRTFRDSLGPDAHDRDNNTTRTQGSTTGYQGSTTGNQGVSGDTNRNQVNPPSHNNNTAQNQNETHNNAVTPTDQGNSEKDVKMTKDIRSAIMDTDMSSSAKNVKIISRNERVTLNGEVDSKTEQQAIVKIAQVHCEPSRVIDNMTVKSK